MGRFISNALFEIKTNSNVRLLRTKRGDKTFAIQAGATLLAGDRHWPGQCHIAPADGYGSRRFP
jgi:hypothetical protein